MSRDAMVSICFGIHAVALLAEEEFREVAFTDGDSDDDGLREHLLGSKFHYEWSLFSVPSEETVVLRIGVMFQRKINFVVHDDAEVV